MKKIENSIPFPVEKKVKGKIIIYGAGRYGEITRVALEQMGYKVTCYIDKALSGNYINGIEVCSPKIIDDNVDENFIIASLNCHTQIFNLLKNEGVTNIYNLTEIINLKIPDDKLSEYAQEELHHKEKYLNMIKYAERNELVLQHCEIVVTEKCSLKCKDCANYIQYYTKPEDISIKSIIKSFDNLLNTIDKICELRLLGGEPFIYKELVNLIKYYLENEKIEHITIYTNGTIIPNQELVDVLGNDKIVVHISNYGTISRKVNDICELFKEKGVTFYVHNYLKWKDFGGQNERNYTRERLLTVYNSCFSAKCFTFYRNRLYKCPRSAHGERLKFFKNGYDESLSFESVENYGVMRKKLKCMIEREEPLTACKYCNGEGILSKEIDAGIQVSRDCYE